MSDLTLATYLTLLIVHSYAESLHAQCVLTEQKPPDKKIELDQGISTHRAGSGHRPSSPQPSLRPAR